MAKNVSMFQSIEIKASPEKIFDYISDLKNDEQWRPEVTRMDVKGEKKVGTLVIEYITVYRFLHFVTPTLIKELNRPHRFIAETPENHPTWVQCIRTMEPLNNGNTLFSVKLSFSLNNFKQAIPIAPPGFLVTLWYNPRIKRYLKTLKRLMEATV